MSETRLWLTVREAAPVLSMTRDGLYRAVREGLLPDGWVIKVGRSVRICARSIGVVAANLQQKVEGGEIETTDANQ